MAFIVTINQNPSTQLLGVLGPSGNSTASMQAGLMNKLVQTHKAQYPLIWELNFLVFFRIHSLIKGYWGLIFAMENQMEKNMENETEAGVM